MLATNLCLPQVEHIKSGTARDFFEVNLNAQRGAVPERNGTLRTQARKLPVASMRSNNELRGGCLLEFPARSRKGKRKNKDCARTPANAIPVHNRV
jgi:hypothetical protein